MHICSKIYARNLVILQGFAPSNPLGAGDIFILFYLAQATVTMRSLLLLPYPVTLVPHSTQML